MELYALEPTVLLHNRYEILAPIGSGGFSVLYKAYDHEMDAVVAIKEYFPSAIAERIPHSRDVIVRNEDAGVRFRKGLSTFREEARRMAELGGLHNTVDVLQTFDENNTGYIVIELLTGQTLLQYLQTLPNGRYTDIEDAKKIICLVAEALAYAHSKKILHRDVSPDNIFLCSDGRVKLIDFGAARDLKEDAELSVVVKAGCTPPEQYRKNGRQGPWTDLYALGATFYRMLTGTYPETAPDRAFGDRECPAPSEINPAVPPYIDALLARCLAYDYTLRVARASEVIDVLRAEKKLPQPPLCKAPMGGERTVLPRDFSALPEGGGLYDLLTRRRSARIYTEGELSLLQLSFLLWATQGVRAMRGRAYATLRTVPSGGARHAFETYLLLRHVEGLRPGAYHYLPMEHALEFLHPVERLEDVVSDTLCGQSWAAKASVIFYWSVVPYRAEWRYGPYAYAPLLVDAGHVGENLYLACASQGLGTCGLRAFRHELCCELFGLDGEEEFIVYAAPVGTVRPEDTAQEAAFYQFVEDENL